MTGTILTILHPRPPEHAWQELTLFPEKWKTKVVVKHVGITSGEIEFKPGTPITLTSDRITISNPDYCSWLPNWIANLLGRSRFKEVLIWRYYRHGF